MTTQPIFDALQPAQANELATPPAAKAMQATTLPQADLAGVVQFEPQLWLSQSKLEDVIRLLPKLSEQGVRLILDLSANAELERATTTAGLVYHRLAIHGVADLKQTKVMAFDQALRGYLDQCVLVYSDNIELAAAMIALRAGWLRGRKIDTAIERGRAAGLATLEAEVLSRLLVPR